MIGRRGFITGMVSLIAAPAIVRVASIMQVKPIVWAIDFGRTPMMMRQDGYTILLEDYNMLQEFKREVYRAYMPGRIEEMPALRQM